MYGELKRALVMMYPFLFTQPQFKFMDIFEHPELHDESAPLVVLALALWVIFLNPFSLDRHCQVKLLALDLSLLGGKGLCKAKCNLGKVKGELSC